jgi:hypothetical protein
MTFLGEMGNGTGKVHGSDYYTSNELCGRESGDYKTRFFAALCIK